MPKYSGDVSWKFSNSDQSRDLVIQDRFVKEKLSSNMSEDGNTTPEHCMKPSQMFAMFGGGAKPPKIEDDKASEPPPAAPKKKKTTFLWTPANQAKPVQDSADTSQDNTSCSDVNMCDSVDFPSQDTFQTDVQTDVPQDHDTNDAKNDQPLVPRSDSVDHNGADTSRPCEEPNAFSEPILDANANPKEVTSPQSMDPNDSTPSVDPQEDHPTPAPISEEPSDVSQEVPAPSDVSPKDAPAPEESSDVLPKEVPAPDVEGSNVEDEGTNVDIGIEPRQDQSNEDISAADLTTQESHTEPADEDTEAPPRPSPPVPQPPVHHQNHQNGPAEDTRIRHDSVNSLQGAPSQPSVPEVPRTAPPAAPPAPPIGAPPVPQGGPPQPPQTSPQQNSVPVPPGAPPAAPPAPPGPPPPPGGAGGPGGPPAPPGPPGGAPGGGPPPPPPPPPPPGAGGGPPKPSGGGGGNDLASQLANAKLKKASPKPDNGGDPPAKRPGGPGGLSMMADLQRKLAARHLKSEGGGGDGGSPSKERISPPEPSRPSEPKTTTKPWEKKNITNGVGAPGSPRTLRRSSIKDTASSNGSADNVDFDRMKQEIMTEMRKEISKMKEEIIEAIKMELNRR